MAVWNRNLTGWAGNGLAVAMVSCLLTGCASEDEIDDVAMARLMKEVRAEQAGQGQAGQSPVAIGSDSPETPSEHLPPLPGEPLMRSRFQRDLVIQPDAVLQVSVLEDASLDGSYPVNDIGAVELGYVGPIFLYNKTEREAEQKIRDLLKSRAFRNATVTVKILRASYDKVKVIGDVNNPGLVRIGAGDVITLNDALLRAGGIRASAVGAKVRIVKGGLTNAVAPALDGEVFSLMTDDGKPTVPGVNLSNNDMAFVFSNKERAAAGVGEKEVTVLGEVSRRGVYTFSATESCSMMHLIFKMGGLPPYANKTGIRIVRRAEDGREREIKVNVEKILEEGRPDDDVQLESGDRVIVPARRLSLF